MLKTCQLKRKAPVIIHSVKGEGVLFLKPSPFCIYCEQSLTHLQDSKACDKQSIFQNIRSHSKKQVWTRLKIIIIKNPKFTCEGTDSSSDLQVSGL